MPEFSVQREPKGRLRGCYQFGMYLNDQLPKGVAHFHPWVPDSGMTIVGSAVAQHLGPIGPATSETAPCFVWLCNFAVGPSHYLCVELDRKQVLVKHHLPDDYVLLAQEVVQKCFDVQSRNLTNESEIVRRRQGTAPCRPHPSSP